MITPIHFLGATDACNQMANISFFIKSASVSPLADTVIELNGHSRYTQVSSPLAEIILVVVIKCETIATILTQAIAMVLIWPILWVINHAYPFKDHSLIQNVFKTILWWNEKLLQHTECYRGRFRQDVRLKTFQSSISRSRTRIFSRPITTYW